MLAVATSLAIAASATGPVVVVHDDAAIPAPCRARAGALTVAKLLESAGRPTASETSASLAPARRFQWFDTNFTRNDRRFAGTTLRTPGALTAHFAKRHRQAERQQLIAIELSYSQLHDHAVFDPLYRYRADDHTKGRWRYGRGKAVIDCRSGGLSRWATVVEVARPILTGRVCGRARASLIRSDRIVACAYRTG